MRVKVDIPGGPVDVVISGVTRHEFGQLAWWTVGGRKIQVSRSIYANEDEPWKPTGQGLPARMERHEVFPLPPASVRRACRDYLRKNFSPGEKVSIYGTDFGRYPGVRGGWDDSNTWCWSTPNDGEGVLTRDDAYSWLRAQARTCGVTLTVDP